MSTHQDPTQQSAGGTRRRGTTNPAPASSGGTLPLGETDERPAPVVAGNEACNALHAIKGVHCTRKVHPPDEEHAAGEFRWSEEQGQAAATAKPAQQPAPTPAAPPVTPPAASSTPAPATMPAPSSAPAAAPRPVPSIPATGPIAPRGGNGQVRPPAPAPRMVLPRASDAQVADDRPKPYRMFLYGLPKIGKSTFGIDSDAPIFLPFEVSPNVPREMCFPQPRTWSEAADAVRLLLNENHPYKTLILDTADAAEPLLAEIVKTKAKTGAGSAKGEVHYMSDVGGGYSKSAEAMVEEWIPMCAALDRLQAKKGMNIIVIAHGKVEKYSNPDGADYDMWQPRLPKQVAGHLMGWCDIIGFANQEITTTRDGKKGKAKGGTTGAHWLHVDRSGATFWAGNRHNLPPKLPLYYQAFAAALEAGAKADVTDLVASIRAKATLLAEHTFLDRAQRQVNFAEWVELQLGKQPPPRRGDLVKIDSRLAAKLQELEQPDDGNAGDQPPPPPPPAVE
jgi:hypothetical protein